MNLAETWHALQCPAIPKANAEMCEFRGQHEFGSFEVQPKMLLGCLRNLISLHFSHMFSIHRVATAPNTYINPVLMILISQSPREQGPDSAVFWRLGLGTSSRAKCEDATGTVKNSTNNNWDATSTYWNLDNPNVYIYIYK